MDWQVTGIVAGIAFGTIGAACGIAGLLLNWRTRRDFKLSLRPIIKIEQVNWREHPTDLALHLRSRSSVGYRVESVSVVWPLGARIAAPDKTGASPQWGRTVTPKLFVAHAGQSGKWAGESDRGHVPLLFSSRRAISSSLAMTRLRSWSARSDSSHRLWALFIVRLTDENAATSVHKRAITLKAPRIAATKGP